jgi:hypothetical protein
MGFTVTGLALGDIRMLSTVAEGAGKGLVLCRCFFHLGPNLFMTWDTGSSRCGHGIINLQWMMCRVAAKAITGYLALGMGLMTLRTIGDLAMHFMAESTGLLSMGTLIIGEILPRALMTGKARLFNITGKVQGQRFMRVRVAG